MRRASDLKRIRMYYWPSGRRGGRDVGHISLLYESGVYISHVPDLNVGHYVGTRDSPPGFKGVKVRVMQHPSLRFRQLSEDKQKFGDSPQTLILPPGIMYLPSYLFARSYLLPASPDELKEGRVLHGPLPPYQLMDSQEGKGDRNQCTTTTVKCIVAGISLEDQDVIKEASGIYDPDQLYEYCQDFLVKRFRDPRFDDDEGLGGGGSDGGIVF